MKKSLKILIAVLSAVALIGASVLGTLAYFTAKKTVTNVFTVGKITIALDEAVTDDLGVPVTPAERTAQGNQYTLMPGNVYTKDPQVTVNAGSEDAYMRVIVRINNKTLLETIEGEIGEDALTIVDLNSNWEIVTNSNGKYLESDEFGYEIRYKGADGVAYVPKSEDENTVLAKVFTQIKASDKLTSEHVDQLTDLEINVEAHAIQADGFSDADDAWAAFDAQMYPEPVETQQ